MSDKHPVDNESDHKRLVTCSNKVICPADWGDGFTAKIVAIGSERRCIRLIARTLAIIAAATTVFFSAIHVYQLVAQAYGVTGQCPLLMMKVDKLLAPSALLFSVFTVIYLTILQLNNKERRDRIEHAVALCETAPDLNDVDKAIESLQHHLQDAFVHYQDKSAGSHPRDVSEEGEWQQCVLILQRLAQKNPLFLAGLMDQFSEGHADEFGEIAKVMAFFEKSAIGIDSGHADDQLIWDRFNVAALKYWLTGYCFILMAWSRYWQSHYIGQSKNLGLPYEHFEAWLRHHCKGDEALTGLLNDLHDVREKVERAIKSPEKSSEEPPKEHAEQSPEEPSEQSAEEPKQDTD
ncbi:MAG: hypothetical protein V7707_14290 [Motiliproteus sp.]